MVPMWMFANALACGNTFVLKPSEKDPSVSLYLAELLAQAGLPAGCFNVVQGDKVAVDRAARAPRHRRGELRRLDPDRPVHLRDRHRATASGCRRSAGPRTTCSCWRTPTSTWPPTPRSAPPTGRPASVAWPISVVLAADSDRRRARRQDRRADPVDQGRPGQRARQRDGPADHRRTPRQGQGLRRRCSGRGCHGRRRRSRRRARRRVLPQPDPARQRHRRTWPATATRSSARCCR